MNNEEMVSMLGVMNQKLNFLIGGVMSTPFKDPLNMTAEELTEETERLILDTEEIEKTIEIEYETHVKIVFDKEIASAVTNKILSSEDLSEEDENFIFDNKDRMGERIFFLKDEEIVMFEAKIAEVMKNVESKRN